MAHLPVRRKPLPWTPVTMLPMVAILAIGFSTTVLLENGRERPIAIAEAVKPASATGLEALQITFLRSQSFEVGPRAWVVADHPVVTHFDPAEMVGLGRVNGWTVAANRLRGLPALGAGARAYDRLYLDLGNQRYQPLRWRDVPR